MPIDRLSGAPAPANLYSNTKTDAVITVVRDPEHSLGKQFELTSEGSINKRAAVHLAFGIARMHHIDTIEALAELLKEVSEDPHAAIINAGFCEIEIGEDFIILSERQLDERLGIPRHDRDRQAGVHTIEHEGRAYKAVGRFKENVRPSCWQYLDRDVDSHTPAEFASLTLDEWRSAVTAFLPEFDQIRCLHFGSTSSRVLRDGQPVGAGNGHLWFRVKDPTDIERLRTAVMVAAAQASCTWLKPRYSRTEPGKVVGNSLTTFIDPSVFTPGRLTFVGKPIVRGALDIAPANIEIIDSSPEPYDTARVELPDRETVRAITRKAGTELDLRMDRGSLTVHAHELTLDTEIETEDRGTVSMRALVESGIVAKVRCQTPFRASVSFAAFLATGSDGTPFVHDVGTGITHWLQQSERNAFRFAAAIGVCKTVLKAAKHDSGAPFESDAIDALISVRTASPAEYHRLRTQLKEANRAISVVALDKAVQKKRVDDDIPETHHGFARDLVTQLTIDDYAPVGHDGMLFCVDPISHLWDGRHVADLTRNVAEKYDGLDNCKRATDYSSIAHHAITLASDLDFFADAPIGLACPSGFYRLDGGKVAIEPLSPLHRQRVQLLFDPVESPTPQFDQFLAETFAATTANECDQQILLVQEIVGAVMLGIAHRYQKAIMFYDPYGRAGKGTLERVIRALVPNAFVTAISPFNFNREYYLASLAGSRLNVVGELPDHESIPAAAFKSVTGGDLLTGRHPSHRTVTFKNEAAHLFMSNHLINTRDHSEAFFSRWIIIEFPNSRLRSGLPIDPSLADRIIEEEMPGIAYWALQGARRLLVQGKFSESIVHDRLMARWRRTSNSLEEFIHECCTAGGDNLSIRRSKFYVAYKQWCTENGRRPFAKGKVRELLEHNIALGVRLSNLDGYEIFRGITLKDPKEFSDI